MTITFAVLRWTRSLHPWAPLLAILRGLIQLAILSLILAGVIQSPQWVSEALVVMFGVAVGVASQRIGGRSRTLPAAAAMGSGVLVTLLIVFASGALQLDARYALAIGGIVIGNTMSIATIGGRRLIEAANDHWDEIEGWFALGATPRQASRDIGRQAVYSALIPTTDQTKTTGIVTLPVRLSARFSAASRRLRPDASRSWCSPPSCAPAH